MRTTISERRVIFNAPPGSDQRSLSNWRGCRAYDAPMLVMAFIMLLPLIGIALFYLLPWRTALPIYVIGVGFSAFFVWLMIGAMKRPVLTGREGMIGKTGKILSWKDRSGQVRVEGEIWKASSENPESLQTGQLVEVIDVQEMRLTVRRILRDKTEW
jgi:membrane-bound ClpP family serine protease